MMKHSRFERYLDLCLCGAGALCRGGGALVSRQGAFRLRGPCWWIWQIWKSAEGPSRDSVDSVVGIWEARIHGKKCKSKRRSAKRPCWRGCCRTIVVHGDMYCT